MTPAHKPFQFLFFLVIFLTGFATSVVKAEPDPSEGEQIFQAECQQCHAVGAEVLGPDLAGVNERRDEDWLISFIRNSQRMIRDGDELANELYEEYNQMVMPAVDLNDREIRSVLAYIDQETQTQAEEAGTEDEAVASDRPAAEGPGFYGISYDTVTVFLGVLFVILLLLFYFLMRISRSLKVHIHERDHPGEPIPDTGWGKFNKEVIFPTGGLLKKMNPVFGVMSIMGIGFIVLVVILYDNAQYVGSQEGYAPEQPIPFDHQLHAGVHEIDCQYCHDGVETSKNANIPSVGVCMNCHSGIATDNPDVQKIIEAYENEEPIEWERIHNIADHAFFSHAQHVNVAGLDCESCHGQVDEMPKVEQVENMTMGWCIDCHRETEVDLTNEYYHESFDFVEDHEKFTISQMGGLDCASCHH